MNGYSFYLSKTSVADETNYKIYLKSDTIVWKGFPPYPNFYLSASSQNQLVYFSFTAGELRL